MLRGVDNEDRVVRVKNAKNYAELEKHSNHSGATVLAESEDLQWCDFTVLQYRSNQSAIGGIWC